MNYQVVAICTIDKDGMDRYDNSKKITGDHKIQRFTYGPIVGIAMKTDCKWFAEYVAERIGGYVEENKDLMELTYFVTDRKKEVIGITYCKHMTEIMRDVLGAGSIAAEIDQVAFAEYLDKIEQLETQKERSDETSLFLQNVEEMEQV